jgi:quercetin dioxygenase-like cupin family protein
MIEMTPGITRANDGMDGIRWNILGQTYIPKQLSESSFSWHGTLPAGSFVPPHSHPKQDEFVYMLQGKLDFVLDGAEASAEPGDLVRLPMGRPHGIFNQTDQDVKCLFWVSPSRRLYDLFWAIHDMGPDADPADLVAVSAKHEVDFLPPPDAK